MACVSLGDAVPLARMKTYVSEALFIFEDLVTSSRLAMGYLSVFIGRTFSVLNVEVLGGSGSLLLASHLQAFLMLTGRPNRRLLVLEVIGGYAYNALIHLLQEHHCI